MKQIPILLLIVLPFSALADPACNDADARYEHIQCALDALDNADKRLNEAYKVLSVTLDQKGKTKLRETQRIWIQFRDADTAFAYQNSGEGGSLGDLIATNHKLDLTLDRIKQLKDFLNGSDR